MIEFDFQGKTALVTGAAGAIGKGIAAGFLRGKAQVYITDLDARAVNAAIHELSAAGPCLGMAADVTSPGDVQTAVAAAAKAFDNRIDVLVNVAGVVGQGPVEDITVEEWDDIFAVNCKGSFLFIKHVAPFMKARRYGRIINFSSKSGKTGSALMAHYSAAKAAVIGMTQALACELADFNINVNCLCPGITENTGVWSSVSAGYVQNLKLPLDEVVKKFTAKVPLRRLARISDIVAATLFLASEGGDYMTGQAINITGGREMH